EATGREMDIDYVINGAVQDFASAEPIQGRTIADGQLSFSANQDGYQLGGKATIDGMEADISVEGAAGADPVFRLQSTIAVADLHYMSFAGAEFLHGQMRFVV